MSRARHHIFTSNIHILLSNPTSRYPIIQHTPTSSYNRHLCLDIKSCTHFQFTPTASHTSLGDMSPEHRRAVRKYIETQQKWQHETKSTTYPPGLSTHLLCIVTQPPLPSLRYPRSLSHHSSKLTSVYSTPIFRLLLSSTPFQPQSTHPFSIWVQTILILSDPHFLSTSFLFQLSTHLFILNSIYCDTPAKLLKNSHFPPLSTSHTPCFCSIQCSWYNYYFIQTLLLMH